MLYNTLHRPVLRAITAVLGQMLVALAINFFIVPQGLYTGGLMGICQLIRTLLQDYAGISFGSHDIAGLLYFLANVPILAYAYRNLGRVFVLKTILCTVVYSFFYSALPRPAVPIIEDPLTSCLIGGILAGVGAGIVLTSGASGGGLDVVGLCLSKKGANITVGKFSLGFNIFLYAACLVLFSPTVAIYSVIYNFFTVMVLDRMHQQNISVQAFIFTHKNHDNALADFIMDELGRGVTYWNGVGAYTGADVEVLCVCLSKYEIEQLLRAVHSFDPDAFVTIQEKVRVVGNFPHKVGQ